MPYFSDYSVACFCLFELRCIIQYFLSLSIHFHIIGAINEVKAQIDFTVFCTFSYENITYKKVFVTS